MCTVNLSYQIGVWPRPEIPQKIANGRPEIVDGCLLFQAHMHVYARVTHLHTPYNMRSTARNKAQTQQSKHTIQDQHTQLQ